ncbi:phage virion morphogenesis protein [Nitratireductor mangrovi]|uniref:Phage virion morphogenesis protein n=1 Tax=Nitratireductor mangrovi TaxID=2599600 RepID=A0A5B8KTY7_9HYPH|nr:phage virion morphogenesis protein [Nitratireductor mangrovi]QDY99064.1 phage virion morphogenesis protein [Nitratireductor mangrovi]
MAGAQIRVDDREVLAAIDRVMRVADNPAAIMADIEGYLVFSTQRHIETERGPDGPWPRLSPRTAAKRIGRRRRGYDHMLRVTNRLYSSITGDSGSDFAAVGTNLVYAGVHQFGATIDMPGREQDIHLSTGRGRRRFVRSAAKRKETRRVTVAPHQVTIPARPFLYIDDTDRAEIERIAADGLRREAGVE